MFPCLHVCGDVIGISAGMHGMYVFMYVRLDECVGVCLCVPVCCLIVGAEVYLFKCVCVYVCVSV